MALDQFLVFSHMLGIKKYLLKLGNLMATSDICSIWAKLDLFDSNNNNQVNFFRVSITISKSSTMLGLSLELHQSNWEI